jgi:AraC-like DNA-binding protein
MYEHQGLQDIFFIMLYGGATLLAIVACCYLLRTRGNMFIAAIHPPRGLRRWAAAFMASVAASHLWWVMLGINWLEDDQQLRNIVCIALDRLTFVPLMMAVLIRMLQDRQRPLWPVAVAMLPFAAIAVVSIVTNSSQFEWFTECYSLVLALSFTIYMVYSVRQYGRWLHDNYADLEHKEVWQSLLLLACILLVYIAYTTNEGDLVTEYLAQVNTLVIIGFVLWRVETLQQLNAVVVEETTPVAIPNNIGEMLEQYCEDKQIYLQHDLTLQQLAIGIGTNRTYLGKYFAQQGITYNTYINQLRIDHFIRLYQKAAASSLSTTAKELAQQSGFRSYSTFSTAFKTYKGITVTAWMKGQQNLSANENIQRV